MSLKDFYEDKRCQLERIPVIQVLSAGVFLVLFLGLWYLQVFKRDYYTELSEKNHIRSVPLSAPRGRILDRNGKIIVDNRPSYTVSVMRDNLSTVQNNLALLASGLNLDPSSIQAQIEKYQVQPSYYPIVIKEDLTIEDLTFLAAHRQEFPSLEINPEPRRLYVEGELAAHLVGYVGEISEKELARPEYQDCKLGNIVGKSGVERAYNPILMGVDGQKKVVVDSRGKEVSTLETVESVAGKDLWLTIDLDIQRAAEKAFGDKTGATVALDPRTGEILALVSRPAFDPNAFATRITSKEWDKLINDPKKPLQNRAIQSRFPPGSVFKIFMTIAGLGEGILTPAYVDYCTGSTNMYGRIFHCWRTKGHGRVDVHQAIVDSCNVFFYHLGQRLGIDKIAYYAQSLGLGSKTGVDLPGEDSGIMPSAEWKRKTLKQTWYAGETISVAIGQGYVSLTPIQLARAFAAIGMGGTLRIPHVILNKGSQHLNPAAVDGQTHFDMDPATLDIVTRGLWGVVNEKGGTGTLAAIDGFDVCGKTGTSQVVGLQAQKAASGDEEFGDNAWFVAFAPLGAPEIAAAAFVEHGGHGGSAAAPIVHEVFQAYYDKSRGKSPTLQLATGVPVTGQ
jgi:penicillin-binding protein 2